MDMGISDRATPNYDRDAVYLPISRVDTLVAKNRYTGTAVSKEPSGDRKGSPFFIESD